MPKTVTIITIKLIGSLLLYYLNYRTALVCYHFYEQMNMINCIVQNI